MYEKIDFHMQKFFGLSHFLIIFFQKMTQAKKVSITKNQFFMPVNHMKEFLKSIHNEALFFTADFQNFDTDAFIEF